MILLDLGEICKEQDSSWRLEKKKEKEKKKGKKGEKKPHMAEQWVFLLQKLQKIQKWDVWTVWYYLYKVHIFWMTRRKNATHVSKSQKHSSANGFENEKINKLLKITWKQQQSLFIEWGHVCKYINNISFLTFLLNVINEFFIYLCVCIIDQNMATHPCCHAAHYTL